MVVSVEDHLTIDRPFQRPLRHPLYTGGWVERFETIGGAADQWAQYADRGTLSLITDTSRASRRIDSDVAAPAGMKYLAGGVNTQNYVHMSFGSAKDLTHFKHGGIRFYVDPDSFSTLATIQLRLYTTTFNTNYWLLTLFNNGSPGATAGWQEVTWTAEDATEEGAFDWSNVTGAYLYIYAENATDTPFAVFDLMEWFTGLDKPLALLTLDDAFAVQYEAAQMMAAYDLCGTFYVPYHAYGAQIIDGTGLTTDELREIRAMGHLIANHSWSHPAAFKYNDADGPAFDVLDAMNEIEQMGSWLRRNGLGDGSLHFASPFGGWPREWLLRLQGKCADTIRLTRGANALSSLAATVWRNPVLTITAYDNSLAGGTATHTGSIDAAISVDGIYCGLFHQFVSNAVGTGTYFDWDDFEVILADLAAHRDAGDIEVITMAELPYYLKRIPPHGKEFGRGSTVPADTTPGWAPGAIFVDTDLVGIFCNIGTVASCNFDQINVP